MSEVDEVAIAGVVPVLTQEWEQLAQAAFGCEALSVNAARNCGIAIAMPDPRQVGADRIANAVAAKAAYGAPVIVVDFGTATNIDVVDAEGAFRGGAIMPGLMLSAQALFSRAAKLSSVPLVVPEHALGNSTETAVQSGIVVGAAAQAEGIVARIVDELAAEWAERTGGSAEDAPRPTIVGTGGLSSTIAQATSLFDVLDPDLTLRGIRQIWLHRAARRRGEA
jgi:type III pantothenate kinase